MKAVIQRVLSASVVVEGQTVSAIGKGLCVLVGVGTDDGPPDAEYIRNKLLNLRLFPSGDSAGGEAQWKASVKDINGEILCVSQFTLMASTIKGNKPDFHKAMASGTSQAMYGAFLTSLRESYSPDRIQDGRFGAMMNVSLVNEGPVTILLDSKERSAVTPNQGLPVTDRTEAAKQEERAQAQKQRAQDKERRRAEVEARTRANREEKERLTRKKGDNPTVS